MANSIEKAKLYVNNQVEHLAMFQRNLLCADLMVTPAEGSIKGNTFAYDKYSFANYVMGTYNRASGASQKDLTVTRVNKVLTQDRGDTLGLDRADKNECQIADGLVGIYNFYQVKVEVPTIDSYAFGQICGTGKGASVIATGSLTSANIVEKILLLESSLLNKRIDIAGCLLYLSVSAKALLGASAFAQSHITQGSWNGSIETNVDMFDGMKIKVVPDATLGCSFAIVHPMSASVLDILGIVEVYDKVPGKPGWAQIDVRDYFDAWVEPTGEDGIAVAVEKPRDLTLTENTDHSVTITGVEKGAKVYYAESSGVTTSSTEITAGSDGSYKIATPASDKTFYVKQFIGTVGGDEKSISIDV